MTPANPMFTTIAQPGVGEMLAAGIPLDFSARELRLAAEPAGFAVHAVLDGEVSSHIQPAGP